MALENSLVPELVFVRPPARTREELFELLAERATHVLAPLTAEALKALLWERERQCATSTAEGVAFPHAVSESIPRSALAIATPEPGIEFAPNHPPARIVLCLFGNSATPWEHVRLLARLSRIVAQPEARRRIQETTSPADLLECLRTEDRSHG